MEQSQDYSFKQVSCGPATALIAYRTAWLRGRTTRASYMAALISSVMNTKDRVPFYRSPPAPRWGSRCCRRT